MNWIVLTSLRTIYENNKVHIKSALDDDPHIQHILTQTHELQRFSGFYHKSHGFDEYYEKNHQENYDAYVTFLGRNKLLKSQLRLKEDDIRILMNIEEGMESGDLQELRDQIIDSEETVRGVSRMFFKNMYTKRLEPQKTHSIHMLFFTQIQEISIYYKYSTQFEKSGDYHNYIYNRCCRCI